MFRFVSLQSEKKNISENGTPYFVIEYLGEIETEFENTLGCLSGAQIGSNHEKSRDTLFYDDYGEFKVYDHKNYFFICSGTCTVLSKTVVILNLRCRYHREVSLGVVQITEFCKTKIYLIFIAVRVSQFRF